MDPDDPHNDFDSDDWTDPRVRPRWRVLLVRLPAAGLPSVQRLLPRGHSVNEGSLPRIIRVTHDANSAQDTAHVLRRAGAAVVVVEENEAARESAFCRAHANELAPCRCSVCATPICAVCTTEAGGRKLCPEHFADVARVSRNRRLRQLFLMFLLAVLLLLVNQGVRLDAASTDPHGTVRVAVLQFAMPGSVHTPLVRQLNGMSGKAGEVSEVDTLFDIGPFFDSERNRYMNRGGRYLALDVRGPWAKEVTAPVLGTPDDNVFTLLYRSWSYARYFEGLAKDQGVDLDAYAARVFVIYGPQRGDIAAHSRGSETRRIAIAYIADDERNPTYAVMTVAHELAHTLGAPDNYDPDSMSAAYPEGFVEPFAGPLYPQRYAELMAVDKPIGPDIDTEVRSLDEVRIGHLTAAKLGWIDEGQARLFYQPTGVSPQDLLDARPTSGAAEAAPVPQAADDPAESPDEESSQAPDPAAPDGEEPAPASPPPAD